MPLQGKDKSEIVVYPPKKSRPQLDLRFSINRSHPNTFLALSIQIGIRPRFKTADRVSFFLPPSVRGLSLISSGLFSLPSAILSRTTCKRPLYSKQFQKLFFPLPNLLRMRSDISNEQHQLAFPCRTPFLHSPENAFPMIELFQDIPNYCMMLTLLLVNVERHRVLRDPASFLPLPIFWALALVWAVSAAAVMPYAAYITYLDLSVRVLVPFERYRAFSSFTKEKGKCKEKECNDQMSVGPLQLKRLCALPLRRERQKYSVH